MDDQNRNLILASALSFLVILVWYLLFPPPEPAPAPQAQVESTAGVPGTAATPGNPTVSLESTAPQVREAALAASARLPIRTARLEGSLSLTGGRIDDLKLTDYKETLAADSPLVTLLTPAGAPGLITRSMAGRRRRKRDRLRRPARTDDRMAGRGGLRR